MSDGDEDAGRDNDQEVGELVLEGSIKPALTTLAIAIAIQDLQRSIEETRDEMRTAMDELAKRMDDSVQSIRAELDVVKRELSNRERRL